MSSRENFRGDLSWGEKWERIIGMYMSISGLVLFLTKKKYVMNFVKINKGVSIDITRVLCFYTEDSKVVIRFHQMLMSGY